MSEEKIELEVVEITSIELADYGDCVILDLIIPVPQTPKKTEP